MDNYDNSHRRRLDDCVEFGCVLLNRTLILGCEPITLSKHDPDNSGTSFHSMETLLYKQQLFHMEHVSWIGKTLHSDHALSQIIIISAFIVYLAPMCHYQGASKVLQNCVLIYL